MTRFRSAPDLDLAASLTELAGLPRERLIELWIEHSGRPPPRTVSNGLLVRSAAYVLQEQHLGRLKRQDLRLLLKAADTVGGSSMNGRNRRPRRPVGSCPSDAELQAGSGVGRNPSSAGASSASPAAPLSLRPGTRLVRDWHGQTHVVDVRERGFAWNGTVYRSLSAVALAITGARWSGTRFFRPGR